VKKRREAEKQAVEEARMKSLTEIEETKNE